MCNKECCLKASDEEVLGGNFIFDKTLLAPISLHFMMSQRE